VDHAIKLEQNPHHLPQTPENKIRMVWEIYTVEHKNVAVNFLQQLLQILTDFDNFCII